MVTKLPLSNLNPVQIKVIIDRGISSQTPQCVWLFIPCPIINAKMLMLTDFMVSVGTNKMKWKLFMQKLFFLMACLLITPSSFIAFKRTP
jgi:hypothetical protein